MSRQSMALRRSVRNFYRRYRRLMIAACIVMFLETLLHIRSFQITRPSQVLDAPFHTGCQQPDPTGPRANATILMLARNADIEGATRSIQSIEDRFNKWYHYPITFLNDKPWDETFVERMTDIVSGTVEFEVIPSDMWSTPDWIDKKKAQRNMKSMANQGIMYSGKESYHHMCRFNSGMFYDHPTLQKYKWFWRVEPDAWYTCSITYDPFVEMEKSGKKYGYTVALWELGQTVPSLFRKISDYKDKYAIKTTSLWTAMIDPSYMPWPLRPFLSLLRNRDKHGDIWNMCHFWSNFEIANMDWFRSDEYRRLFEYLDADGGFYYERWGDAPVHSLAAALLLEPRDLHHFSDFGYVHEPFQYCPFSSTSGLIPDVRKIKAEDWVEEYNKMIGCDCYCDTNIKIMQPVCLNKIKSTVL